MIENPSANVGDVGEVGSIPESGRSLGERDGNPLQCSCLKNPIDKGAQQATVQRGHKESELSTHTGI